MFRRLGIFAGGFTPDAAEHVVADDQIPRARVIDHLEHLVERSLLTRVAGGSGARFRLLEPVRQYAAARLGEAGEHNALARRHLEWVRRFAGRAFLEFFVEQRDSTVRIGEEHPNICQALEFGISKRDGVTAAEIIAGLAYPWFTVGQPDARLWCERVLAIVPIDAPPVPRAGALFATAMMLQEARQYAAAASLLLEARELYRSAKDLLGEAWTLTWLAWGLSFLAPGSAEGKALYEEALSLSRESNVPAAPCGSLVGLAEIALGAGDDELARQRADEAVQLGRSTHISQTVAAGLHVLAVLDSRAGDFESADRRLAEMIAIHEAAGDRFHLLSGQASAAKLAASRGEIARATSHLAEGAELAREMPSSEPALELVLAAAYVAYVDGSAHDAAMLFGARLGLSPVFPEQFRPTIEALQAQGLGEELAAGANLSADEALARVVKLLGPPPQRPPEFGISAARRQ